MLKVYVDTSKVKLRFDRLPADVLGRLSATAQQLDDELLAKAKGLASGTVLQVKTGKYLAHIKGSVRTRASSVTGRVWVTDPRANLFEFGGKTGPHDIEPNSAQELLLQIAGGQVFAAKVHHPGGDFGRESFGAGSQGKYSVVQLAYNEMRSEIFSRMYDAAFEGVAAGE
jgi:hypothetical protein